MGGSGSPEVVDQPGRQVVPYPKQDCLAERRLRLRHDPLRGFRESEPQPRQRPGERGPALAVEHLPFGERHHRADSTPCEERCVVEVLERRGRFQHPGEEQPVSVPDIGGCHGHQHVSAFDSSRHLLHAEPETDRPPRRLRVVGNPARDTNVLDGVVFGQRRCAVGIEGDAPGCADEGCHNENGRQIGPAPHLQQDCPRGGGAGEHQQSGAV